jgi:hypothetical protein
MKKSANNLYKQLPHMDSMFDSLRALLYVDPRGSTGTRFGSVQDWGEGKIPFIIEESKNGLPKRPKHQHLCPIMKEFCKALLEPDVIDKEMIIKGTTGVFIQSPYIFIEKYNVNVLKSCYYCIKSTHVICYLTCFHHQLLIVLNPTLHVLLHDHFVWFVM